MKSKAKKKPIVKKVVAAVKKVVSDTKGHQLMVDIEYLAAEARSALADGSLSPLEALEIAKAAITLAAHLAKKS